MSNTGQVWDRMRDVELVQTPDKAGYLRVKLAYGTSRWTVSVHRLVAGAFYEVDISDYEVNHLDGDKSNNNIRNLELCNRSQNMRHAYAMGLVRISKETRVRCLETGEEFKSIRAAARYFEISCHKTLSRVLDTEMSVRGFHFETIL